MGAFEDGFNGAQMATDTIGRKIAGNLLAKGDYQGGANMLYQAGQLDEGAQFDDEARKRQKEDLAQRLDFFDRAATALEGIPDTDGQQTARRAAVQRLVPTFQAMGMDDKTIGTIVNGDLSNPSLQAFRGHTAKLRDHVLQGVNLGGGGFASFNGGTGEFKVLREPSKATKVPPGFMEDPEGGGIVVDPNYVQGQGAIAEAKAKAAAKYRPAPRGRSGGGGGGRAASPGGHAYDPSTIKWGP